MPMDQLFGPQVETFDNHYRRDTYILRDKTFYCTGPNQTALTLTWPKEESIAQVSAILEGLCFKPGTYEWENDIVLVNPWAASIVDVNGYAGPTGNFHNGIVVVNGMDVKIHRPHFVHCISGVVIVGDSEGPHISHPTVLGAMYGVYAATPLTEAGMFVNDFHFSVSRAGIVAVNRPQSQIHDGLIYRHHWRSGPEFDPIYIGGYSHDCDIHDVKVRPFGLQLPPIPVTLEPTVEGTYIHNVRNLDYVDSTRKQRREVINIPSFNRRYSGSFDFANERYPQMPPYKKVLRRAVSKGGGDGVRSRKRAGR